MALTELALRALRPRDRTSTVSDGRGLYVEIFPTGGVVWRYRYRLNCKQEKLKLGKYPDLTLKNACQKRDEAARMAVMGDSPAKQKQQVKESAIESVTVAEFGERFFKEIVARDCKNITLPRRYFDKSIVPAVGNKAHRPEMGLLDGARQADLLVGLKCQELVRPADRCAGHGVRQKDL